MIYFDNSQLFDLLQLNLSTMATLGKEESGHYGEVGVDPF